MHVEEDLQVQWFILSHLQRNASLLFPCALCTTFLFNRLIYYIYTLFDRRDSCRAPAHGVRVPDVMPGRREHPQGQTCPIGGGYDEPITPKGTQPNPNPTRPDKGGGVQPEHRRMARSVLPAMQRDSAASTGRSTCWPPRTTRQCGCPHRTGAGDKTNKAIQNTPEK